MISNAIIPAKDRADVIDPLRSKGWSTTTERDAIKKTFMFGTFKEAFKFMQKVAKKAEKMDHHPEWFNCYNKIEVTLSTHTCNGLSLRDIEMANFMEHVAARFLLKK